MENIGLIIAWLVAGALAVGCIALVTWLVERHRRPRIDWRDGNCGNRDSRSLRYESDREPSA